MPNPSSLGWSDGSTSLKTTGGNASGVSVTSQKKQWQEKNYKKGIVNVMFSHQVIVSAEESLKDFEQRITELKTRGAALQVDQVSTDKLLKLQVTSNTTQFGFLSLSSNSV